VHKNPGLAVIAATVLMAASPACGSGGTGTPASVVTPDRGGEIRQWASSATASSEYGNPDWAAVQAAGAPDTPGCGDHTTAWASFDWITVEWLEVGFATPVIPTRINIHQTYNPGSIVRVEVKDTAGVYHTVYTATPVVMDICPYPLSVVIPEFSHPVEAVRITLDQSRLQSWNEIDAVELVGYR
jgi:hypothetical protein